jgi:hypothetical protein
VQIAFFDFRFRFIFWRRFRFLVQKAIYSNSIYYYNFRFLFRFRCRFLGRSAGLCASIGAARVLPAGGGGALADRRVGADATQRERAGNAKLRDRGAA